MAKEVRHPVLSRLVDEAFNIIDGIKTGNMERSDANTISTAVGRANQSISHDIRYRLALPKLIVNETKMAEAELRKTEEEEKQAD
jgi:hypothetical protein